VRRTRFAFIFAIAALSAGLALVGPTSAQETPGEGEGDEVAFLNITKVVDGDGPTGGYVIEYFCTEEDIDMAPEGGGGGSGGALAFDQAGPGAPETQQVILTGPGVCTVTETDSNGATTVAYACEFEAGDRPAAPDGAFGAEGLGGCIDDQSGRITSPNDELTITVTNTFEADVDPGNEEPPPAVNPGVVNASPAFTG
jgi:hypothetical protein